MTAESEWEEELGRILIEDDHCDHIKIFYSSLYRVLLFPRMVRMVAIHIRNPLRYYKDHNMSVLWKDGVTIHVLILNRLIIC
ncbi:MAG: glycoside hydrolase family 92 protein [Bacteroidetes bacterium]|nr:glycoside hydrolase family 92 protein [Bacteroidota bacterium]